jgi:outer membrane receptor protein involved in Fe transport
VRYDTTRVDMGASGGRAGLYAGDRWRIAGPLTADAGLRYDSHSYTSEGRASPRAGLALALGPGTVVRAAWGRYYQAQGIGDLDVQEGVTGFRRVAMATHYVAGVERRFGPGLEARVEGYFKRYRHIRDRFENLQDDVEFLPELRDDRVHLFPETGTARGIEFYLKRDAGGRLSWWTAYAYAITRETYDLLQSPQEVRGRTFPRRFDQPHTFSIDVIFRPSPAWHLSAAWQIRSGWPFSPLSLVQATASDGSRFFTTRWDSQYERYPPFHRLDVKAGRQFTFRRWRLSTSLEVVNLYNRRNVRGYDYFFRNQGNQLFLDREAATWLPILPSLTVSAEF